MLPRSCGAAPVGPWGHGPFDNDDAQDFVLDLANAPTAGLDVQLAAALTSPGGYLGAEGSMAVAAAALVAIGQA